MEYNVKIIRANRKSLSVCVSPYNEITVRCPKRISNKAVNDFLESKKQWLNKVISKNRAKLSANDSVLSYKEIFVNGEKLPLVFSDKNLITENAVYVKSVKHIKNLFISQKSGHFLDYVKDVSRQINLHATDYKIRSYKSRWGSCDGKGLITFNYLLFMLPPELQRYVIIHELCHTVYFNHSPKFWQLVSSFIPNYKTFRNKLKNFDFIIKIYSP